nr:hypothetical protein [Phycisphaeraceae bacterium]
STFAFSLPACDSTLIIRRYLHTVVHKQKSSGVSALQISSSSSCKSLADFMTTHIKSTDLVLPGQGDGSVLVFGITDRPLEWAQKLQVAWSLEVPGDDAHKPFEARWVGTWPIAELQQAMPHELDQLMEEHAYAQ